MARRVLLTGTEGWVIDQVERALLDAGHTVLSCHLAGEPTFPCYGLRYGTCRVDQDPDVVLTVRARPLPQPTRREAMVTCALRADVPLIVAGSTAMNPFAEFTADAVEGLDAASILRAVERTAASRARRAG